MEIRTSLNLPHHVVREPVATPFYAHPYGGIARDISVSREGFMRFFEMDDYALSLGEAFAGGKVVDQFPSNDYELVGYIGIKRNQFTYDITVIHRSSQRISELLQIAPYLWQGNDDCDPHGIELTMDQIDCDILDAEAEEARYSGLVEDDFYWGDMV